MSYNGNRTLRVMEHLGTQQRCDYPISAVYSCSVIVMTAEDFSFITTSLVTESHYSAQMFY